MKLIVFAPYFYPHKGGLEKFCEEIAIRVSKKHSVFVVTSKTDDISPLEEDYNGIHIFRLESLNILGGTYSIPKINKENHSLWAKISKINANVVITNTRFFLLSYIGQKFARKNNIFSIHIEHGTSYPQLKNPVAKLIAVIYDQTLGRLTFRSASKAMAISKAAADFSRKLGARGKIDLVYNSIDTSAFKPNPTIKRKKQITFIGRIIEAKGIQDLIAAFEKIKDPELTLNIIGKGNYLEVLKSSTSNKRIIFHGEKNSQDLKDILGQSLIFVNPSYSEGLPTSVLEAGAMECAVIATDVGGTREIITNDKDGYLIPVKRPDIIEERLKQLLSDESKCKLFGEQARIKIVENFDWLITSEKLIKLIENETNHKN